MSSAPPASFPARTPDQLFDDLQGVQESRHAVVAGKSQGDRVTLDLRRRAGTPLAQDVEWVVNAHTGILARFATDFVALDQGQTAFGLLAVARHLFETLIWLRLFDQDASWGDHFHGQLLKNEREDLDGLIAQHQAELARFKAFAKEETAINEAVTQGLAQDGDIQDEIQRRLAARDASLAALDDRVRAGFNLHALPATFNGYAYQAHLIETVHLDRAQKERAAIQARLDAFEAKVGDEAKLKTYLGKWNWKARADAVGLTEQYEFFYRLTSRLLHATPMNLITEKDLTLGERLILLDFMIAALTEAYDLIARFAFPGQLNLMVVQTSPD